MLIDLSPPSIFCGSQSGLGDAISLGLSSRLPLLLSPNRLKIRLNNTMEQKKRRERRLAMRNQRARLVTHIGCCLPAAIFLIAITADTAVAMQSRRPPDLKAEQRKREVRETMLRNAELGVAIDKADQKRIDAAIKQVQEDFKEIQIVRNKMVRDLLANKPLDYKLIAGEAGEINKRAERLKTFLMPPVPEDKEKGQTNQVEFTDGEMKDALVRLCNLIAGFVDNPVLKTPGVTDVEQSAKAGGDLLDIIELSGNIKRSAERLNRAAK
ncbi:MAG TPA: hypothetical protein VNO70_27695 [Blastocatellia bacterium]|nr:hypothetical protein [Blastocatellia bacterium]